MEAYRQEFGVEPPPFDKNRLPKCWFDSTAATLKSTKQIVYKTVGILDDGSPDIVPLILEAREAATVNIVPGNVEGNFNLAPDMVKAQQAHHVPVPVRDLNSNEALTLGFGNVPVIVNIDKRMAKDEAEGRFLPSDRALLQAIAGKLGL